MLQVIEAQLAPLNAETVAGAYRAICAMMLLNTAMSSRRVVACNEDARQKKAARQWVQGGGILPYAECCEALGLDKKLASECIQRFAETRKHPPINRVPAET